eukprot:1084010-Amphidinium_carterae.1
MAPKASSGQAVAKKPAAKSRYGLGLNQIVGGQEALAVKRHCGWPIGLEKTAHGGASLGKEIGCCILTSLETNQQTRNLITASWASSVCGQCSLEDVSTHGGKDMHSSQEGWLQPSRHEEVLGHKNFVVFFQLAPAAQTWTSCIERLKSEIAPIVLASCFGQ